VGRAERIRLEGGQWVTTARGLADAIPALVGGGVEQRCPVRKLLAPGPALAIKCGLHRDLERASTSRSALCPLLTLSAIVRRSMPMAAMS